MAADHHTARRGAERCSHRQRAPRPSRSTRTTVLFVDVVDSTATAARMGDEAWCDLIEDFDRLVGQVATRLGGTVVKSLGDGALIRVDDPGLAVTMAHGVMAGAARLGLEVRAGAHLAEVRIRPDGDVAGIGVHIGARVAAKAGTGEVWCSEATAEALDAAAVAVHERGAHPLKGLEGHWSLYAAGPTASDDALVDLTARFEPRR